MKQTINIEYIVPAFGSKQTYSITIIQEKKIPHFAHEDAKRTSEIQQKYNHTGTYCIGKLHVYNL